MSPGTGRRSGISVRLRAAREMAGLSQSQVAELMHLHRPTITEIEAGRRKVASEELSKFADLYQVSVNWLLDDEDAESGESDPRVQLAARELGKLSPTDLDRILALINAVKGATH